MASPAAWLEVLSWVKALFDATTLSADVWSAYKQHKQENSTVQESERVSVEFSSYSETEIKAIIQRLEACRDRFIAEGSGPQRARCLCSVFEDIKAGNGGVIPQIDDWQRIYSQLCSPRR